MSRPSERPDERPDDAAGASRRHGTAAATRARPRTPEALTLRSADDRHQHRSRRTNTALLSSLAGLTSLGVLLQGLWAGLFLPVGKGGPYNDTWVEVHNWGARVTLLLALATTVVAFVRHRARRDLWIGALVLTVLIVIEASSGAPISDGSPRERPPSTSRWRC